MSNWEIELEREIMDCWLLSNRGEIARRLKEFVVQREREAWEQGWSYGSNSWDKNMPLDWEHYCAQKSFDPAKDEREHLERIRREVER